MFSMSYQLFNEIWPIDNRSRSTLIHILDDYSLLNVFLLCRPMILDKNDASYMQILQGGNWNRERWWYRLLKVCRRWRYLILDSPLYLRLSLVCARGTPVADILAHSPPFPLIIDYLDQNHHITAEDEEGIILALQHRDRVRRIRLENPIPKLQRLVNALDGEFPILEYLYIDHQPAFEYNPNLIFPETFRTPHLRHLVLMYLAIPIGSTLLSNMGNLVTLSLNLIPPFAYFHPDALLQRLLLMPHLETLWITSNNYFSSGDVERQLSHRPIMTRVTLPNLRWLAFRGANAYLEALLPGVTIPLLEKIQVYFINQLTYSIQHLQQSMNSAGNLRPKTVALAFSNDYFHVGAFPQKWARMFSLYMELNGRHLDWQVASAARVFHSFSTVFSAVEHLTLHHDRHSISSEWNNEADITQWRELLGCFNNVETLRVGNAGSYSLIEQLSRALQPDKGGPTALLPALQELTYSPTVVFPNAFTPFIDARQKAGCPVTVVTP